MKSLLRPLMSLLLFAATAAAQTHYPQGLIQHVIVVVQENRTPDNLFGSNPSFLTGANVKNTGNDRGTTVNLTPTDLSLCYDIGHSNADWVAMWDSGKNDHAYYENYPSTSQTCTVPTTPPAPFAFVKNDNTTMVHNVVQPYIDIAKQFGFANYMFQTNQGPSFPAHQFLFSGTSAPTSYPTTDYNWFAAENPTNLGLNAVTGCAGVATEVVYDIAPTSSNGQAPYPESYAYAPPQPPDPQNPDPGYPCYNHPTMSDLLGNSVSWKYYTQQPTSLWTAPVAIYGLCQPSVIGGPCQGSAFQQPGAKVVNPVATVLQDIYNCTLPAVSWVTPDGAWSDHAGSHNGELETLDYGPSWVAAIVNAVGNGIALSGVNSPCNPPGTPYYWKNTVILVTWDDWGGWYDHVIPPGCGSNPCTGYANSGNSNGVQYVYGFRVPLLVVSAYSVSKGYISDISGRGVSNTCPTSPDTRYCHDFGSILNFIEYTFGSNGNSLGQIGSSNWPYADYFALDGHNACASCPYSLSDFFNFGGTAASFTPISAPKDASYFVNYTGAVQDPDDDGVD